MGQEGFQHPTKTYVQQAGILKSQFRQFRVNGPGEGWILAFTMTAVGAYLDRDTGEDEVSLSIVVAILLGIFRKCFALLELFL